MLTIIAVLYIVLNCLGLGITLGMISQVQFNAKPFNRTRIYLSTGYLFACLLIGTVAIYAGRVAIAEMDNLWYPILVSMVSISLASWAYSRSDEINKELGISNDW